jgi:hypothetical protein
MEKKFIHTEKPQQYGREKREGDRLWSVNDADNRKERGETFHMCHALPSPNVF